MRQTIPLRAVLQMHDYQVITHDIGTQGIVTPQLVIHVRLAVADSGSQHRGTASGVKDAAARKI